MGTSIGATIAWWIAAETPDRVKTLVRMNIPHPAAIGEAATRSEANSEEQRQKSSYFRESSKEANERVMFERMLASQNVPPEESEPYRRTATVADLEAAKQRARPSTIRKLAKALGIRHKQLLGPPRRGANVI